MPNLARLYILAGIAVLSLLLASISLMVTFKSNPVVTFDKDSLVKKFVSQLSHKSLSQEQMAETSSRFATAMKGSLDEYAQNNNVIIIKKDLVFASNYDVTTLIAAKIAARMRAKS